MTWHDVLKGLAELKVDFDLCYDAAYGVDRKSGWSFTVNGVVVVQFAATPEEAVCQGVIIAVRNSVGDS